jgi:hypothetical protein
MQWRGDEKKKPPGQAALKRVLEYFFIIFICLFIFIVQALGSSCCFGCVAG